MAAILVVEDDPAINTLLAEILEDYTVTCVSTGEAALGVLSKGDFSLMITDLTLPGISGARFLQQVREHVKGKTLPLLILSGAGTTGQDVAEAFHASYLEKPFNLGELLAVVASLTNAPA